jgi:type IV pilus biogenesis protein CpaD/CtpE
MKRVQDLVGITGILAVAVTALLAGCTRGEPVSSSVVPASSSPVSVAAPAVASDSLPEVVISAQRVGAKPIVLSERDAGSASH